MSAASQPPPLDDKSEDAPPPRADEPRAAAPRASRKVQPSIWQRAVYRWIAVSVVMSALLVLYTQHPYYRESEQFAPFRAVYPVAFVAWLTLGVFYVKATLEKFDAFRYTMRDSGLHLIILARAYQQRRFWARAKNRRLKTTILGICVKAFFTPLMIGFFRGHLNGVTRQWLQHKHLPTMEFKVPPHTGPLQTVELWWTNVGHRVGDLVPSLSDFSALVQPWAWTRADYVWGLGIAYDVIFAVDCGWALFGYSTESRWLGNKTRSVEPTAGGWLVCLTCYPPFNSVLGTYLPLKDGAKIDFGFNVTTVFGVDVSWLGLHLEQENALLIFRTLVVVLFAIYASATVAFGFKFSNLTNRGIVSRGPYRFVRHPAYLTKCCAWWLEHLPTLTIYKVVFLSGLCGWYALRAWTEERHLSADPDYVAYKKKVPWVLIPRVY